MIRAVRFLGLLALATALWTMFFPAWLWRSHVYFWVHLPELFGMVGTYAAIHCILFEAMLIAKFIVSYGLFRVRSWGRPAAIAVLAADFVFRASGAITMFLLAAFVPPAPPPPMPEDSVTLVIPMWPSYLIGIISIASVLVLIQKPIKTMFRKERIA